jgi:nucleoside-diphosphate-sugar epimerase
MVVAIAGAHGKIGMLLASRLVARGVTVTGLIRRAEQVEDLEAIGTRAVVCDLETAAVEEIVEAVAGADAVVFAAGAGPGSGAERKLTMDRDGAIELLRAASQAGAARYVIISSVGAENPPDDDDVFSVYLRAKAEADAAVQASDRESTIVRPGRLTDEPGTGRVRLDSAPFRGEVPRPDVAAVIDRLLDEPRAAGRIVYVNAGELTLEEALNGWLAR